MSILLDGRSSALVLGRSDQPSLKKVDGCADYIDLDAAKESLNIFPWHISRHCGVYHRR